MSLALELIEAGNRALENRDADALRWSSAVLLSWRLAQLRFTIYLCTLLICGTIVWASL